ncbi:YgfZ/GcvT domain-containing protein [Methylobacillus glycogenes]|uniref:YgfZ/GcvT domain-containing protein n=1 Tax=Methylobacillus glycogenes TaxID=406 RepID=UPI000ADAD5A6|nr:hypothetical protein [Methylobacillus glycogenes]
MSAWQEFLSSRTPTSTADDAEQAALALPTAEAGDSIMVDLSHYGLLSLEGEDAQTFLQGQVTNDVKLLNGSSHYSGYCSPKGRLLALFLAFAHDGKLWLQFDGGLTAAIAKRLRMYVLRSKVVITEHSAETLVRLGVAGQQAEAALRAQFTSIPETEYAVVSQDGLALIRLPGSLPRYEIIIRRQKPLHYGTSSPLRSNLLLRPIGIIARFMPGFRKLSAPLRKPGCHKW